MTSLTSQSITEKSPYYFSTPSQTPYDGLDKGDNGDGMSSPHVVAIEESSVSVDAELPLVDVVDRPWWSLIRCRASAF